jgi:hypothetical protein
LAALFAGSRNSHCQSTVFRAGVICQALTGGFQDDT